MPTARILLIDDHAMFRNGMAVLLRMAIDELEVLEADCVTESLHNTTAVPDLVLLDILLQGINGIDGMDLLKRKWPRTPVVIVSSDASPETVKTAMARGASGFASKAMTAEGIIALVKDVLNPLRSGQALQPGGTGVAAKEERLTPRQLEVLELMCHGLPNKAIGRRLDLTENTVRWHVQGILAFLDAASRSEAAFAARSRGLIN
jgi:DNA-binding NarL/FixJ family response regulator